MSSLSNESNTHLQRQQKKSSFNTTLSTGPSFDENIHGNSGFSGTHKNKDTIHIHDAFFLFFLVGCDFGVFGIVDSTK